MILAAFIGGLLAGSVISITCIVIVLDRKGMELQQTFRAAIDFTRTDAATHVETLERIFAAQSSETRELVAAHSSNMKEVVDAIVKLNGDDGSSGVYVPTKEGLRPIEEVEALKEAELEEEEEQLQREKERLEKEMDREGFDAVTLGE